MGYKQTLHDNLVNVILSRARGQSCVWGYWRLYAGAGIFLGVKYYIICYYIWFFYHAHGSSRADQETQQFYWGETPLGLSLITRHRLEFKIIFLITLKLCWINTWWTIIKSRSPWHCSENSLQLRTLGCVGLREWLNPDSCNFSFIIMEP